MFCELNGNIGGVRYTLVTLGTLRHCDSRVTLVNSVLLGTHFACVTLVYTRQRAARAQRSEACLHGMRVSYCYGSRIGRARYCAKHVAQTSQRITPCSIVDLAPLPVRKITLIKKNFVDFRMF